VTADRLFSDGRWRPHNHGMANTAEAAWHAILTEADSPHPPGVARLSTPFAELVRVAHAEPLLRQLYPWTGMWQLHFSRCTEIRHTWDIPYVGAGGDGRYYVEGPGRTSPRITETESARTAVAVVVGRLPPDCGPAFLGNAEELAAYERAREGS